MCRQPRAQLGQRASGLLLGQWTPHPADRLVAFGTGMLEILEAMG